MTSNLEETEGSTPSLTDLMSQLKGTQSISEDEYVLRLEIVMRCSPSFSCGGNHKSWTGRWGAWT